jgi:hypothetical protein
MGKLFEVFASLFSKVFIVLIPLGREISIEEVFGNKFREELSV